MRTLLLADRPFRDLRSRAILEMVGAQLAKHGEVLVADAPEGCLPPFRPVGAVPSAKALGVRRIVLAGEFTDRVQLERALYVARQGLAAGATLEAWAFGVNGEAARGEVPASVGVLDHASPLEVREHRSADALLVWRVDAAITVNPYTERHVAADAAFTDGFPSGPILGVCMLGGRDAQESASRHGGALRARLEAASGWPLLALPAEAPGSRSDDLVGSRSFALAAGLTGTWLWPEADNAAPQVAALTPARLKAMVARCAKVITNQDLVAAYAVAAGVPLIATRIGSNRRIITCIAALANELAPGSSFLLPELRDAAPAAGD
jgi:hypothetical protein